MGKRLLSKNLARRFHAYSAHCASAHWDEKLQIQREQSTRHSWTSCVNHDGPLACSQMYLLLALVANSAALMETRCSVRKKDPRRFPTTSSHGGAVLSGRIFLFFLHLSASFVASILLLLLSASPVSVFRFSGFRLPCLGFRLSISGSQFSGGSKPS